MSAYVWPSREEWQAKAEYAVRTSCTMYERLDRLQPDTCWTSLGEDIELEELAPGVARQVRPLLTAEIRRLSAALPDRPKEGKQRSVWFVALEDQAYEDACNLGSLEQIRRELQRAARTSAWGAICWHVGRIRKSYAAIVLPDGVLQAHDRMEALFDSSDARRTAAAKAAEQSAVDAEIARRATDQAWQQELQRRADIDSPRVIRVGWQTSPSKGDQVM